MKKFLLNILGAGLLMVIPSFCFAQWNPDAVQQPNEENFRASVIEVIEEKEVTGYSGETLTLQNLKLVALSGSIKGEEFVFDGIQRQVATSQLYRRGDVVLVSMRTTNNVPEFYLTDIWRINSLLYLAILFLLVVVIVGRRRGLRALFSLALTFLVIFAFTIPLISKGGNPIIVTLGSAIFIILISMLLLYGWNIKSQAAIISIAISIFLALILSYLFVKIGRLTGFSEEEAMLLTDTFKDQKAFSGLLLAAFSLGALGILDDVVLTQMSAVEQLKRTNPHLHPVRIYKRAMRIGIDHIASMINTLFLAYAGSAFFLLFLIQNKQPPFNNFFETINNELVATEIIRSLVGSVGLILAIPIATYIASFYYFKYSHKN